MPGPVTSESTVAFGRLSPAVAYDIAANAAKNSSETTTTETSSEMRLRIRAISPLLSIRHRVRTEP